MSEQVSGERVICLITKISRLATAQVGTELQHTPPATTNTESYQTVQGRAIPMMSVCLISTKISQSSECGHTCFVLQTSLSCPPTHMAITSTSSGSSQEYVCHTEMACS